MATSDGDGGVTTRPRALDLEPPAHGVPLIASHRRAGLPLVIHCRGAFPDLLRIFTEEDAVAVGGVIHCFSGTPAEAEACLALGFALSFSGIVTFKTADQLREAVRRTPLDRLLIET